MSEQSYFTLVSAEKRAEESDEFWIPSLDARKKVKKGYFVKLIFEGIGEHPRVERMWVEVTYRNRGKYKGVLKNSPAILKELIPGDPVEFSAEHICDISRPTKSED